MAATVRGISVGTREGDHTWEGEDEYTVVYYVRTDSVSDGAVTVLTAPGIPILGEPYMLGNEIAPQAVVIHKHAQERESPTEWEVEVTYSARQQDDEPPQEQDPTQLEAEISLTFESRRVVIPGYFNDPAATFSWDYLSLGIVNSAGEPFDPQPEYDIADPLLTISKNLREMSAEWLMNMANTVNATDFFGASPRQLRLLPPTTRRAWDKVIGYYWPTTFQFAYRYETWDLQLLNIGTYYIDDSGNRQAFTDAEGHPFRGLLAADGNALNASDADKRGRYATPGDDQTFQVLRIYREIDFNQLGII